MKQYYTVCLCFGREKCEIQTAEIAKRNNADSYIIEPVGASQPFNIACKGPTLIAYKGLIIKEEEPQ